MPRKKSNIHYIYKTTCLVTNRYYFGMHSTCNLNDNYMGSGKRLRYSIRKYGIENHKREILLFFESRELLIKAEENFITDDMINDTNCMNLRKGGTGGFSAEQQKLNAKKSHEKQLQLMKNDMWVKKKGKNISKALKIAYAEGKRPRIVKYSWKNKFHTNETKLKIGNTNSVNQQGIKNSQYGTHWITNGLINKKIKKNEIIPIDWWLGRCQGGSAK